MITLKCPSANSTGIVCITVPPRSSSTSVLGDRIASIPRSGVETECQRALGHGPDSYGRLRHRILIAGAEDATELSTEVFGQLPFEAGLGLRWNQFLELVGGQHKTIDGWVRQFAQRYTLDRESQTDCQASAAILAADLDMSMTPDRCRMGLGRSPS